MSNLNNCQYLTKPAQHGFGRDKILVLWVDAKQPHCYIVESTAKYSRRSFGVSEENQLRSAVMQYHPLFIYQSLSPQ